MTETMPLSITGLETGKSHLIEANAGTGKTHAIANLAVRFILEGIPIERLLIVTFTNAATDELRGRIREHLRVALDHLLGEESEPPMDDFLASLERLHPEGHARDLAVNRLQMALLNMNEAAVHTIHGFCQQALRELAFSAGQGFEQTHVNDDRLKLQAVQDFWRKKAYGAGAEMFRSTFADPEQLFSLVEPLLAVHRPQLHPAADAQRLALLERTYNEVLQELANCWQTRRDAVMSLLFEDPPFKRQGLHKTATLVAACSDMDACLSAHPPRCPKDGTLSSLDANAFRFKKGHKHRQADFAVPPFTLVAQLRELIPALNKARLCHLLAEAAGFVRRQLDAQKAEHGWLAFDDMIERLHEALYKPGESTFCRALAERYPLIMVDEFQDTDPRQYDIFRRVHQAIDTHTLIMIGDPKQAIYAFRGGDVFTFMQARREVDQVWSLTVNWRASREMVESINGLFSHPASFVLADITHLPSTTPEDACRVHPLMRHGAPLPSLVIERLPDAAPGKPPSNSALIERHVHEALAARIRDMLDDEHLTLDGRRLLPSDIAILVRTGQQARSLRRVLQRHGISAAITGGGSIWKSPEADGLMAVLAAMIQPEDRRLLRQALCASWIALSPRQLHEIISTTERWGEWVDHVHTARERWLSHGFMAGFQSMLRAIASLHEGGTDPSFWLNRLEDPQRSLTNLLHLAELLQQASRETGDGRALLAWMRHQQRHARDEEHPLRLENDQVVVRIMTIHKSKGLQFPVVFVPALWSVKPLQAPQSKGIFWHERDADGSWSFFYDPSPDRGSAGWKHADEERVAEDVRLAYVALTRARSHCHVYFDHTQTQTSSMQSGLAWILTRLDDETDDHAPPTPESLDRALTKLAAWPGIRVHPPHASSEGGNVRPVQSGIPSLHLSRIRRTVDSGWRIASFTSMTRSIHQPALPASRLRQAEADFAFSFPAGTHAGLFMHALLERLDLRQPITPQLDMLMPELALRHGLSSDLDIEGLAAWLADIAQTPLNGQGFRLADIRPGHALQELPFDFRAAHVRPEAMDRWLRPVSASGPSLDFEAFTGLITGVIDLVFEHQGRYYLADYKSNHLGHALADYAPDCLRREMEHRRYDVQALLYAVAWHRHMQNRHPTYDYESEFGGIYYLFLRGMRPQCGPNSGIHFWRPEPELIMSMERDIFGGCDA